MFKPDNKEKQSNEIETVIGPSVKVEGDFEGSGDMVVEGIVMGSLKTKNFLRIGAGAKIKADVEARNAHIAGEVSGNLTIKENLELTASAKVLGDIKTNFLAIEQGAVLNGKVTMNSAQETSTKPAEDQKN